MNQPQWWWKNDTFNNTDIIPEQMHDFAGPKGIATLRVFNNGATQSGWSREKFMKNYLADKFNHKKTDNYFRYAKLPFAFLMRSMSLICIDIDAKNGGLEHAHKFLGNAGRTLAETSKSGDGLHLFYSVPDEWDAFLGFSRFPDFIGIEQGVDIRSIGCVYHYPSQRWNDAPIRTLPKYLREKLERYAAKRETHSQEHVSRVNHATADELLLIVNQLEDELKKDIPEGRRNSTLFAIGLKMRDAQMENWRELVARRALEVGLPKDEIVRLTNNIGTYVGS